MNKYKDIKEKTDKLYRLIDRHISLDSADDLYEELENYLLMVEKETRKEIEGIVDVVLGYIEDEKEYKAAKSRWETLKSK